MTGKGQPGTPNSPTPDAHNEQQAIPPDWDALPDSLLGQILAAAGRECRRAVTLTCKRWRQAYHLEPSLQPTFNLHFSPWGNRPPGPPTQQQQEEVERRVARLASSAGLGAALRVTGDPGRYGFKADDVLGLLPATLLRRAHLSGTAASADWLLSLHRFAGLTALDLYVGQALWPPLPGAGWDGLAAGLSSLRSLRTLRTLRLRALAPPPQAAVDAIAALAQLTELEVGIDHAQQRDPPCWLPLAQLSGLRRLCLAPAGRAWMGPGGQHTPTMAPTVPAPATFPRLRSLVLEGRAYGVPVLQVPIGYGGALRLAGCRWEAGGSGHLEVHGLIVSSIAHLEALTAAMLPPRAPLRSLALHFCWLDFAAPHSVSPRPGEHGALAGLTALQLHGCGTEPRGEGSTDRALAGLLAACGAGLRRLSARRCQLSELPAAPCLAGLEELNLRHCQLDHLPPALAIATSLTSLCLDSNSIQLTPDDVAGGWALSALPAGCPLVSLSLGSNNLRDLPAGHYLAGLTRLDLSYNALCCLPPALATATSLRVLILGGNISLRVGLTDVWWVLSQLKHVAHISLSPGKLSWPAMLASALVTPHLCLRG